MEKKTAKTRARKPVLFERSAGGIVLRGSSENQPLSGSPQNQVLMIEVENLQGKVVWTFPKGHLEKGETASAAALREVLEETGWKCEIVSPKPADPKESNRVFEKVLYFFKRSQNTVRKEVIWYLMKPVSKIGEMDSGEVRKTRWVTLEEAAKKVVYNSDKTLLGKLGVRGRVPGAGD